MPRIQVELTDEEYERLRQAAASQHRSKEEQLAFTALQHARALLETAGVSAESAPEPDRDEPDV